jgi:hypothetical protein
MKSWNIRAPEIAYLLNPPFCGRLLYTTIKMYNEKAKKPLSFPLIYLVLPLVLHKETRSHINSRTKFHLWIQKNPDLLIDFPKRTRDLVPITNESIEFLLQTGLVKLTSTGELQISSDLNALNKKKIC